MKVQTTHPVPAKTAQIARAALPHGNRYLTLRDKLGTVFDNAMFAHLFAKRGRPAEAPWRLALVTVVQFAENLSDRKAAEAVRTRLDLKYLLGLELEADIEVVGRVGDGREALALLEQVRPNVLVTDIEMPGLGGLELAEQVKAKVPGCRTIVLTTFSRSGYLRRALELGISGYLLKDSSPAELANAIRHVHAGGRWIDPELAQKAWTHRDPLTEHQREVLRLVEQGRSNAAIANQLDLSEGTVRNYLHDAMNRLDASNRTDAVRIAREQGWL